MWLSRSATAPVTPLNYSGYMPNSNIQSASGCKHAFDVLKMGLLT